MTLIQDIFEDVKTYLKAHHMVTYDSWIMGCVEYFIQRFSLDQIRETAYQQWLLHDLKDIGPGFLPEGLSTKKEINLDNQFILQINSVLDISVPAYQQYLKLKKTDIENIKATMDPEEKISSKRMLKFELTDGKQKIVGIEYKPLSKINSECILPGSKILIKGPVRCVRGVLLLTESVVQFLGGECEKMLEKNCLAAQLALKLNLPSTDAAAVQEAHVANGVTPAEPSPAAQSRSPNDVTNTFPSNHTGTHSNPGPSSSSSHGPVKRSSETEVGTGKKVKLDEDLDEMDVLGEELLLAIEESIRSHSWSPEPFVYIKQINELSSSEKNGKVFRVKAQIQNVLTKLTITLNQWSLKCTIIDGTGVMDVEVSSDILAKFLGYTPETITEVKKKINTNPELKKVIDAAFVRTAESLKTLYCIMELTMYSTPKITRLIDFDDEHARLLLKRLSTRKTE